MPNRSSVNYTSDLGQQTANSLLMCPPNYYSISYEINPWMSIKHQAKHKLALKQWHNLYKTLTQKLKLRVQLLKPRAGVPDLVFTANAGLAYGKKFIRSNFRHPERQLEEPIIEKYFKKQRYEMIKIPARFDFEGEGDALWFRQTLIFGFRFRSDAPVHTELSHITKKRVLPLELADKRFYHLDTCFCPLNERSILWFPGAFDRYGRRVIENLVEDPIAVSESDAKRFACNAIVSGKTAVIQDGCSMRLKNALKKRGFKAISVDLSEFLKAGGSAKCLVLKL